jgi:preprotein translocase subunit SecG
MYTFLTVVHVFLCSFLILVVLLQAGKGGGMGIAFGGSGGSQTVFGSSGAGNFLTRLTAICASAFFINSLVLAYLSSHRSDVGGLQTLSQRNAAARASQQAATDKIAKDLEKARKEIDKTSSGGSATPPATPGAVAPATQATPPAAAPAAAPATESDKAPPATPAKPRPRRVKASESPRSRSLLPPHNKARPRGNPPPAAPPP